MNLETFFSHFELFADAPNGVQKLRELILQLAVQGKLVPQNPDDEPAAVLLEKIKEEKERLVKEGKIKKSKKLPSVDVGEMAFELPEGWEWCRWGDISEWITYGFTRPMKHVEDGIPIITAKNVINGKINFKDTHRATYENFKQLSEKDRPQRGDILITKDGSIGRAAIVDKEKHFCINQSVAVIWLRCCQFSKQYLLIVIQSTLTQNPIWEKAKGAAIKHISITDFAKLILPIPPLNEQHRIVAKVDALMKLCDELETRSQNKRDRILKLGEVATTKLLTPTTKESFNQHWKTISDNFDLLYSTPENVKQLRQAILQLAVMGKLVPQNPNDEPAAVLLEKIKAEKERLVKEGKIKKSKELPPVDVGEMAFDLPEGWEWARFEELAVIIGGVTKGRKLIGKNTAFYPYLRVANVQRGYLDLKVIKEIEIPIDEIEKYRLQKGDILLTEGGDWDKLGRTTIWNDEIEDCIHQNHVFRARCLNKGLLPNWIALYTNSLLGRSYFEKSSKKTTNLASINMTQLRNCPIPLPPLNEQHRIVTKVNQMMCLCDEFEAKLTQSINDREKLMSAAVRQVLAA